MSELFRRSREELRDGGDESGCLRDGEVQGRSKEGDPGGEEFKISVKEGLMPRNHEDDDVLREV
jgi:hypothetical protein